MNGGDDTLPPWCSISELVGNCWRGPLSHKKPKNEIFGFKNPEKLKNEHFKTKVGFND